MIELIAAIPILGFIVTSVVPFLFVISIVVFVHEFGHYIVGRWCGIAVEVFSIGLGPAIVSRTDGRGTRWQIAAIPVGGFVRFLDESSDSAIVDENGLPRRGEPRPSRPIQQARRGTVGQSFDGAPVGHRALTVAAGPIANIILSILLFAVLVSAEGVGTGDLRIGSVDDVPGHDFGIRQGDRILEIDGSPVSNLADIEAAMFLSADHDGDLATDVSAGTGTDPVSNSVIRYRLDRNGQVLNVVGDNPMPARVYRVDPLSPASRAGLKPGDLILTVGPLPVRTFRDLRMAVRAAGETAIDMQVQRDSERLTVVVLPERVDREIAPGEFEEQLVIGVRGAFAFRLETVSPGPLEALFRGVVATYRVVQLSVDGIYHIIAGNISPDNLQGPLGIAQISGELATTGFIDLLWWTAVISTAIGLLNLMPIPVLDGGHLVLFAYEAVAGRRPAGRVLGLVTRVGIVMLLCLMAFATYNDIVRIWP
ncbi:MAG: RIP metalloprotease RseP [Paracoccaceae bacterium]|nr:RIP metalloprotease RseP [Paracoccaceae bacterium]